jgi:hypothetical protein
MPACAVPHRGSPRHPFFGRFAGAVFLAGAGVFAAAFPVAGLRAGVLRVAGFDAAAFFASAAIVAASFSTCFDSAASFLWIAASCFWRAA